MDRLPEPLWHGAVRHIGDMVTQIRGRCRRGFGTMVICWKSLVLLSELGLHMQQRGLVNIPCTGNVTEVVEADTMLSHIGINLHAFWNHRGHARHVLGRRRALLQKPEPRSGKDSLALWLLELIIDARLPPYEMDVTASEEFGMNSTAQHMLYDAGISSVVSYLGLKKDTTAVRHRPTR
jgi:hypothetical protein